MKMEIVKCDKCGKVIRNNISTLEVDDPDKGEIRHADLCKSCAEEFEEQLISWEVNNSDGM